MTVSKPEPWLRVQCSASPHCCNRRLMPSCWLWRMSRRLFQTLLLINFGSNQAVPHHPVFILCIWQGALTAF